MTQFYPKRQHQLILMMTLFYLAIIPIYSLNADEVSKLSSSLEEVDFSELEKQDDLKSLKKDLGIKLDYLEDTIDKNDPNTKSKSKKELKELEMKMKEKEKKKLQSLTLENDGDEADSELATLPKPSPSNKEESKIEEVKEGEEDKSDLVKESIVGTEDEKEQAKEEVVEKEESSSKEKKGNENLIIPKGSDLDGENITSKFDVGEEEKKIIELSKFVINKIPDKEWSEVATAAKTDKHIVQSGENLWKISKRLFGSGFYYAKVWSLNSYITNPHEIKPEMVLVFDTGDSTTMPQVQVGSFEKSEGSESDSSFDKEISGEDGELSGSNQDESATGSGSSATGSASSKNGEGRNGTGASGPTGKGKIDFNNFADDAIPGWIKERSDLRGKGHYFQYTSDKTYEDLAKASEGVNNKEYERYEPTVNKITFVDLTEQYDDSGFSKDSKIVFNFREGFALTTLVTSNIIQDLGEIDSSISPGSFLHKHQTAFVKLNPSVKASPGDIFSLYTPQGKITHPKSDRSGFKYVIVGEIKLLRMIDDVWECKVIDASEIIQRGTRITVHTPRLSRIVKNFNDRTVEALIIGSYSELQTSLSYGDVAYIDRGRADGIEVGNVLEVYSFQDGLTEKKITVNPTYKIGELTVLTLTDNFATVLITNSTKEIATGSWAVTKTKANAALAQKVNNRNKLKEIKKVESKALNDLDVELNLDDINKDLMNKVDEVQLSDEELGELERQEREKSFLEKEEKDLKDLERIEKDIEAAENQLKSAKLDEDKLLQDLDLNNVEKKTHSKPKEIFDSLNELEKKEGKKYLDENLNTRDNPYGLSKLDLEEVDELINKNSGKENKSSTKAK